MPPWHLIHSIHGCRLGRDISSGPGQFGESSQSGLSPGISGKSISDSAALLGLEAWLWETQLKSLANRICLGDGAKSQSVTNYSEES